MKKIFQNIKTLLFLIFALGWLWVSLQANPLAVHGLPFFEWNREAEHYYSHADYDINSVMLTRSPIIYALLQNADPANGFSFRPKGWKTVPPELARNFDVAEAQLPEKERDIEIYSSSYHLQGKIWSWVAVTLDLPVEQFEDPLRRIGTLLTAITTLAMLAWYRRQFGIVPFLVALASVPMMTGMVLAAPNLFRAVWIAMLPLVVSFWTYGRSPALHYVTLTVSMLVAFLFSLEYASNLAAAVALPAVYHSLRTGRSWSKITISLIGYLAIALIAFFGAVMLTAEKIDGLTGSSGDGITHILLRGQSWSQIGVLLNERSGIGLFDGLIKIGGTTGFTIYGAVALPNAAVVVIGLSLCLLGFRIGTTDTQGRMDVLRAWSITTIYALAASLSWIILQFQHVALHPRFVPFLLAYPFLLCLSALIGLLMVAGRKNIQTSMDHARTGSATQIEKETIR